MSVYNLRGIINMQMINRVGIFCLYEESKQIFEADVCLLKELKDCVNTLIVVLNGEIQNYEKIKNITSDIIIRHNCGYDVAAYKEALFCEQYHKIIKNCDELVLCNNSFFGPFVSFQEIFQIMNNRNCDFWGISSYETGIIIHIMSYFLVFRKNIINDEEFFWFFKKNVTDDMTYKDVCRIFENGLFYKLCTKGYKYDALVKGINYDTYSNSYESMRYDKVPIMKKKSFNKQFFDKEEVLNSLKYISEKYGEYELLHILDVVKSRYDININVEDISSHIYTKTKKKQIKDLNVVLRNKIINFIKENKDIYIYGAGAIAYSIYTYFFPYVENEKLKGFIVSDNKEINSRIYYGYPVYHYSELQEKNKAIILALNEKNTNEVLENIKNYDRSLNLYEP